MKSAQPATEAARGEWMVLNAPLAMGMEQRAFMGMKMKVTAKIESKALMDHAYGDVVIVVWR